MDPLTHALSGALLARATAQKLQQAQGLNPQLPLRTRIIIGFSAAAFPDLDLALRLIDTITYLNWHQGPTHSLILLPAWAFLLSFLFAKLLRHQYSWKLFYLPVCLGIGIHIMGDLITSYGLMLFAPFSTQRFSLPLAFVIDPWFSLIIISGLVLSFLFPQKKSFSIYALLALVGYIAMLWHLHERALNIGTDYMKNSALHSGTVHALPQPLSPFNWKIIIHQDDSFHLTYANLWPHHDDLQLDNTKTAKWLLKKMADTYQPTTKIIWQHHQQFGDDPNNVILARKSWQQPAFEKFRSFSVFPLLDRIEHNKKGICFWFYDLRFQFPELPPSFRYGICQKEGDPEWQMLRQKGLFLID